MAETIKQKKTPVAKLDKILLAQPNDPNMDMATAPTPASVPAPTPAKTNQSGKGKAKVPPVIPVPSSPNYSYTPKGCDNGTNVVALGCTSNRHPTVWNSITKQNNILCI